MRDVLLFLEMLHHPAVQGGGVLELDTACGPIHAGNKRIRATYSGGTAAIICAANAEAMGSPLLRPLSHGSAHKISPH